jgi:hypothetical protein
MKKNNRLDNSFGPVGTTAGIFMFFAGLIITYYSFFGLILAIAGAFVGFSSTSTIIDYDKRRIKFSNNLFGILKVGKWISIEPNMKIGIKKSSRVWRAYSRSNQTLDIVSKDFRITLYDSNNEQIMPIKKANTLDSAKAELEILGNQLGLTII